MSGRDPSGEAPFDPVKLARIRASLERQGVTFLVGSDGKALARLLGAAALYWPTEPGGPGIVILPEHPTCAMVIEELIHLGQHRRRRWRDVSEEIPALELEAQSRLIHLGLRWGWPYRELERFTRASRRWSERT
jgi:hypothetical protein